MIGENRSRTPGAKHVFVSIRTMRLACLVVIAIVGTIAINSGSLDAMEDTRSSLVESSVSCLICEEGGDEHWFWPSGHLCTPSYDPPFGQCSACGGTSTCHADAQEGPCHVECGGVTFAATIETMDALLEKFNQESGNQRQLMADLVAREVALNAALIVAQGKEVIELHDCDGEVQKAWPLPYSAVAD